MTGSWVERGTCFKLRDTVGGVREALRVFYPEEGQLKLRFRLVCDVCPVECECLLWGILAEEWGGWGGTDEDERREYREQIAEGFTTLADILRQRDCAAVASRIDDENASAEATTPAEAAVIVAEALSEEPRPVVVGDGEAVVADSPPRVRHHPPVAAPRRRRAPRVAERASPDADPLFDY